MKNKNYHADRTISRPNTEFVERGKIGTPNTPIHERSLSWLGTGISIKSGGLS